MKDLKVYPDSDDKKGKGPYRKWFTKLNPTTQARITSGLERLRRGNESQVKSLGTIYELKYDLGPGYRVYYLLDGVKIIVLLGGGDKSSQAGDIQAAKDLAQKYWEGKSK